MKMRGTGVPEVVIAVSVPAVKRFLIVEMAYISIRSPSLGFSRWRRSMENDKAADLSLLNWAGLVRNSTDHHTTYLVK